MTGGCTFNPLYAVDVYKWILVFLAFFQLNWSFFSFPGFSGLQWDTLRRRPKVFIRDQQAVRDPDRTDPGPPEDSRSGRGEAQAPLLYYIFVSSTLAIAVATYCFQVVHLSFHPIIVNVIPQERLKWIPGFQVDLLQSNSVITSSYICGGFNCWWQCTVDGWTCFLIIFGGSILWLLMSWVH